MLATLHRPDSWDFDSEETYDLIADQYEFENVIITPSLSSALRKFAQTLPTDALVLDAGCGTGRDMNFLESLDVKMEGCDCSSTMLAKAQTRAKGRLFKINFAKEKLPSLRYDGAIAIASLVHLNPLELDKSLCNLKEAIKPGGFFLLTMKRGVGVRWIKESKYKTPRRFHLYSPYELQIKISTLGFLIQSANSDNKWIRLLLKKPLR